MSKLLGPKAGYIEILDQFTSERIAEDAAKPSKYLPLRPSSAGKCARELGFELMEYRGFARYEKTLRDTASDRLLKLGHTIESHLLWQFKDAFKRADKDMEIRYKQQVLSFFDLPGIDRKVEGAIDAVFVSPKWKCLMDVKSKKDKFSSWHKTHWLETDEKLEKNKYVEKFGDSCFYIEDLDGFLKDLNDPFWSNNFIQLNMYFHDDHEFLSSRGVDHCALVYYNKNDSRLREIRFKPSLSVYQATEEKFRRVDKIIEETKDPMKIKKDYTLGSIKCAFCSFSTQCHGGKNTLKEYFKTWPKKKWPTDSYKIQDKVELEALYDKWTGAQESAEQQNQHETKIIEILDKAKVNKVKFSDGKIFDMKALKSGGIRGGPRMVLRRGKL